MRGYTQAAMHMKQQVPGVMPVGSDNLGVGPVPVNVEAKGRDWTVESNMSPTPGRSLVGTRSVYLLANSELLSNTIDKGKMGVGPVLVTKEAPAQRSGPQHPCPTGLGTKVIGCTSPNLKLVPAQCPFY